jgi:multicomponent Na+:H+ antiporter subunit D
MSPSLWIVLPIIIPLATAIIMLFTNRMRRFVRGASLGGGLALLLSAIWLLQAVMEHDILVLQMGSWPAPYGISLVVDLFSAIMVLVTGIVGLAVAVYSTASIDEDREAFGYHPLYYFLIMGVNGAFLTGDIFNLYVWFEVMLMASFVLIALGGERRQIEGAIQYVALNLISSALFLAAIGILYGLVGTLNMADLALKLNVANSPERVGILTAVALLFLVAFGIKSAVFPLFFWLPASYHTPPPAVSALFAGLLTKVGVYSLIRVFTLLFIQNVDFTHTLILVISGLTMVTGVFGAIAQNEFRRILSVHIISQIGYMTMGLAIFTPLALAASVFFIAHQILVKTNLFLISGLVEHDLHTGQLKKVGGMLKKNWGLAALFLVSALSLAGIPPLSGFFAKLALVQAGFGAEQYLIVGVSLAVSLFTLFSMIKIWNEVFWKPMPEEYADRPAPPPMHPLRRAAWLLPIIALAVVTVLFGLGAGGIYEIALRSGEQLMDPSQYIRAVLGDQL